MKAKVLLLFIIIISAASLFATEYHVSKEGRENNPNQGLAAYQKTKLPVWAVGNLYYHHAKISAYETNYVASESYNPDGTPATFNRDYFGKRRTGVTMQQVPLQRALPGE